MAEKRMFTKKITDSDTFIELSSAAQALYFHLNQGADDDGFNNQVQMAMWKAHASIDDLKVLIAKNYIIRFESGVIAIKHWRMHNTLRKDRYTTTNFQEELAQLGIKDNGSYTLGCQVVAKRLPQSSVVKNSIDKYSVVECSEMETKKSCDDSDNVENYEDDCEEDYDNKLKYFNKRVILSDNQLEDLLEKLGLELFDEYVSRLTAFIEKNGAKIKSHYDTILKWYDEDRKVKA